MGLVLLGLGVYSQGSIIIEPQTQTILANAANNLTFIVKLQGVNQTPEEANLYFNIYAPNGQLIYQYYEPISVCTGLNIYQVSVNPLELENLVQQYSSTSSCSSYTCSVQQYYNFTVQANVTLLYPSGLEYVTANQTYNLTFVPYNLTLSLVQLPEVISQQQAEEYGISVQSVVYLQNVETSIQSSTLTLTLYDSQGNIVYQTQENVNLQPGENLLTVNIPNYYLENVQGEMYVSEQLDVVLSNGQVLTQQAEQSFYISNNQNGQSVQVISISPNFNSLNNLVNSVYNVEVLMENPSYQTVNATVQMLLYDQYGDLIYNLQGSQVISPDSQGEVTLPLNTMSLQPGYYTLILYVYQNGAEVYQYKYTITVNAQNIQPVNVLSVYPNTFNVKPGQFVELYANLESNLPMNIQVQPIVESQQLNIFQQLSTVTLSPNQVTQLPVVIYIPANLTAGYYPIEFVFNYNGISQTYTYNLYVNGTVIVPEPISASLVGYLPLKYGQNSTIYLVISSNTTQIYNLLIQAYAVGGEVYPEQQEVQIGGTYTEQIPLNVTAESNNVTVYVNIIDQQTGQLLYSLNETYSASQAPSVSLPSLGLIFWILVILAIIIIAAVLIESRRGGKKEKEKAEE
ncbi:S-layer domain-containing protein [Candidatus Nanobsidianus stetteri]|uniref:S-layer domain-containing protein n=1 Tax=Nanobsidianus stetteri TaxID=1294122 RepID=R1E599_NANST|nr:S-layer domain-containing protein [Candidatus Nanobsidianus stetteri]